MSAEIKHTLLSDASDAYESWHWGDPALSKEEVTRTYVEAVRSTRDMDRRRGTSFGHDPIDMQRLTELGIDPETLEPVQHKPQTMESQILQAFYDAWQNGDREAGAELSRIALGGNQLARDLVNKMDNEVRPNKQDNPSK